MESSVATCDAHVHLNGGEEGFKRLEEDSVEVLVGTCPKDWEEVVTAAKCTGISGSVGIHPWFLESFDSCWLEELERIATNHPSLGIGEIGLDTAWRPKQTMLEQCSGKFDCKCLSCLKKLQQVVFEQQLRLGLKLRRRISLHCVRAHGVFSQSLVSICQEETYNSTSNTTGDPTQLPLINLHSWSGSPEMVQMLLKHRSLSKHIFFGTSLHVNCGNLFRFDLTKTEELTTESSPNAWVPKTCAMDVWIHTESGQVTNKPWRLNTKAWSKFVRRMNAFPRDRILLESDVSARSDVEQRKTRLFLCCVICADALDCETEELMTLFQANLVRFISNSLLT